MKRTFLKYAEKLQVGDHPKLATLIFLGLVIIIFGIAYKSLLPWRTLCMADLITFFPSLDAVYANFVSSWSDIFLGRVSPLSPGEFLAQFSLLAITWNNPTAAQGIFYLSMLPLSCILMYLLLKHLIQSNIARVIVAILYGLNGLTIEWFFAGGYALLPWHIFFPPLMLLMLRILDGTGSRILNILLMGLTFGLIVSFQIHMHMLWIFLPFIVVFFVLESAKRRDIKYSKHTAITLIWAGVIVLLLSAPIIIEQLYNIIGYYNSDAPKSIFAGGYTINSLVDSISMNYNLGYSTDMFNLYTYLMVPFAFLALWLRRSRYFRYYLGFLFIGAVILFLSKILSFPWILEIFKAIPVLFVIRSPARLAFMLSWTIFPMMAIVINEAHRNGFNLNLFKEPQRRAYLTGSLCVLFILASLLIMRSDNAPPFNNTWKNLTSFMGTEFDLGTEDLGYVPESFSQIRTWVNERREEEGDFRTLWLPCSRTVTTKAVMRYDPSTFVGGSNELDSLTLTLMPLMRENTEDIGKLLASYDVKYIVVSLEDWTGRYPEKSYKGAPRLSLMEPFGWFALGSPQRYIELLDTQQDLKLTYAQDKFLIYENLDFVPQTRIAAYNKVITVAPMDSISTSLSRLLTPIYFSGFENTTAPWILGTDLEGAEYSISDEESHTDEHSLQMKMSEIDSYATINRSTEVKGDTPYNLSMWVKGQNTDTFTVRIYFKDNNNEYISINDSNYIRLTPTLHGRWTEFKYAFETPSGAVHMELAIDMGMGWSFIDKTLPAFAWLDDIRFSQISVSISPVRDWEYMYGYDSTEEGFPYGYLEGWTADSDAFPLNFLKGQMLIKIPELLSKIPYMDNGHNWFAYGDFMLTEQVRDTYMRISDSLVFLGDLDTNKPYKQWTDNPDSLLFIYEAESELSLSPLKELAESYSVMNGARDATNFWIGNVSGTGTIGAPKLSASEDNPKNLTMEVGSGTGASWYIVHRYDEAQNWADRGSLTLRWYGHNTGGTIRVDALTSYDDIFQATFSDSFSGWRYISLPFNKFNTLGSPAWSSIKLIELQMEDENVIGTWQLGSMSAMPKMQDYQYIVDESYSFNKAIELTGQWEASKEFLAPRAGYYRTLISAKNNDNVTLYIDGNPLFIENTHECDSCMSMFETSSVYLDEGTHTLLIESRGSGNMLDQFLILATRHADANFTTIFQSKPEEFSAVKITPSEYNINIKSEDNVFIVLKDSSHPGWQAETNYGTKLKYLPALPLGWANGFYLDRPIEGTIKVHFDRQTPRKLGLAIWFISLALLIIAIAIVILYRYRWMRSLTDRIAQWIKKR